jgi:hypothetical protein
LGFDSKGGTKNHGGKGEFGQCFHGF